MNNSESQLLDLLLEGKELYGFKAVRSEFEAEGVRDNDLAKLVALGHKANLEVCVKIGGCEAVSDLKKCKDIGANIVVAPMVETPYALSKFVNAIHNVYENQKERSKVKFLFNIETITSLNNLDYYNLDNQKASVINGIVFGRVDFASSMDLSRNNIEGKDVLEACFEVSKFCKNNNIEFVIGGGVTPKSYSSLMKTYQTFLSTFETRKIVFSDFFSDKNNFVESIRYAVKFECLWLKYLRERGRLCKGGEKRLLLLEKRLHPLR